jgi:hypothetical protein
MALRRCRECGHTVSSRAAVCPSCGGPLKSQGGCSPLAVGCLSVILLVIGTIWLLNQSWNVVRSKSGITGDDIEAAKRESAAEQKRAAEAALVRSSAQTFSVDQVVSYYAANEVAGDEALKGKVFKVQGAVDRVGKDIVGRPYVAFRNPGETFRSVQCMFDKSQTAQLSALRPGQHVTIFGKCSGLMMNVLLDDCEIVATGGASGE